MLTSSESLRQKLRLGLLGLILGFGLARPLAAASTPVILNVTFGSPDAVQHIGSTMTVFMSAVLPSQTLGVSVTAAPTTTTLTVNFSPIPVGGDIYITDGTLVWRALGAGAGTSSVVLDDSKLFNSGVSTAGNYTLMANSAFRGYVGTLVTRSVGGASMVAEIGSFDSLALNDPFDLGTFSADYYVRDLGITVSSGHIYGSATCNGLLASNAPFQSNVTFELDAVRPQIDHFNLGTSNPNYPGTIYVSAKGRSLGQPDPTNGSARLDITTNKRSVSVSLVVKQGATVFRDLPAVTIPSNAVGNNGFRVWDARDNGGNWVADGTYTIYMGISDIYGVQGTTRTANVRVSALRMSIANISASPSRLLPDAVGLIRGNVDVRYNVVLDSDLPAYDIGPALADLGYASPFSSPNNYNSTIVSRAKVSFLDALGTETLKSTETDDRYPLTDEDQDYLAYFRNDPRINPFYANCYANLPGPVTGYGERVYVADGNKTNDESGLFNVFSPYSVSNPTSMSTAKGYLISVEGQSGASFGSVRLRISEQLNYFNAYYVGDMASTPNFPDPCSATASIGFYRSRPIHFAGTNLPVMASDLSVVISAVNGANPVLDTTAPTLLASNPADSSTVAPFTYGPTAPITYSFQDTESGMDAGPSSLISVKDPTGAFVAGLASTNGGTAFNSATLSFAPFAPLVLGGDYTVSVQACNQSGLCVIRDFKFNVRDQTAPSVSGEELVLANQPGTTPLSLFQTSPDGPYDSVTEVWATISMPPSSTNTIVWDNCSISLEQISGTARTVIPSVRISPALGAVPTDGKIKYRITDPITTAGLYEVVVQTLSRDASGTTYAGPASFTQLRFKTVVNPSALNIRYLNNQLAMSGTLPITVQAPAATFSASNSDPAARRPDFSSLAVNPNYTPLGSATNNAIIFTRGGTPITQPMTWDYPAATFLRVSLYYNDTDLPTGVLHSDLKPFGYTGSGWQALSSSTFTQTFTNVTNNAFVIDIPDASPAYAAYAIFYPTSNNNSVALVSPTALPFKSTRSFNPNHANAVYRKARFYYGAKTPKEVEARIFDANGVLIRVLNLGNGINLSDLQTDPAFATSQYFFEWDGRNDSGTLVRNGIYLARWRATFTDNTSDSAVKPVALIK